MVVSESLNTIRESIIPDACNGTWYGNGGKAAATIESTIPDACNGVFCTIVRYLFGNVIGVLSGNLGGFGSRFQKSGCPVLFIVVGEKAAATLESILPDARNGAWNNHRGKAAAPTESIPTYARNGAGYDHGGKAAATLESPGPYARNGAGNDHRGKAAATLESTVPDARN